MPSADYLIITKKPRQQPFQPISNQRDAERAADEVQKNRESETVAKLDEIQLREVQADPNRQELLLLDFVLPTEIPVAPEVDPGSLTEPHRGGKIAWGVVCVGAHLAAGRGAGVKVAILDSGINSQHKAFSDPKLKIQFRDFVEDFRGVDKDIPFDRHGHGTHCAGTLFGRDVDGTRIGVAPGVTEVAVGRILCKGRPGSVASLRSAWWWAIHDQKVQVISLSLRLDFRGTQQRLLDAGFEPDVALDRITTSLQQHTEEFDHLAQLTRLLNGGALLIAATGNESDRQNNKVLNKTLPATINSVKAVGALDRTATADGPYSLANFSNSGSDVVAPGSQILSADAFSKDRLVVKSGTSMAVPHVAGIACLWGNPKAHPGWAEQVWANISGSAQRKNTVRHLDQRDRGAGLVCAPDPQGT